MWLYFLRRNQSLAFGSIQVFHISFIVQCLFERQKCFTWGVMFMLEVVWRVFSGSWEFLLGSFLGFG